VKKWEAREQRMHDKVSQQEEEHRRNNILICGLEERKDVVYIRSRDDGVERE
jgi:hypothetical protein